MQARRNLSAVFALLMALAAPLSLGSLACGEGTFEDAGEEIDDTAEEAEEETEETFE